MSDNYDFKVGPAKRVFCYGERVGIVISRDLLQGPYLPKDDFYFLSTQDGVLKLKNAPLLGRRPIELERIEEVVDCTFIGEKALEDGEHPELVGAELWCKNVFTGKQPQRRT